MSAVLKHLAQHWWCERDENGRDIPLTAVNQINVFGEAPIHIAAWKGQPRDLKWLLENGADVNQKGEFGMTPIHYAYMGGKAENVQALLNAGADPSIRCEAGLLPHEGRPQVPDPKHGVF
jgi:hypothetical protein